MLRGKWPRRRGKKSRSSRHDSAACNSTPSAGRYGLFHLFYLFIFYLSSICKKKHPSPSFRRRTQGSAKVRGTKIGDRFFFVFVVVFENGISVHFWKTKKENERGTRMENGKGNVVDVLFRQPISAGVAVCVSSALRLSRSLPLTSDTPSLRFDHTKIIATALFVIALIALRLRDNSEPIGWRNSSTETLFCWVIFQSRFLYLQTL